jgi:HAD superfamily hydrolase (TIGR01509 family)
METRLIIFDLDGVLIDSKETHYASLNSALGKVEEKFQISIEEHLSKYDGLPTKVKLQELTNDKGLPTDNYEYIWKEKQKATYKIFESLTPDVTLIEFFKLIKSKNVRICVASNSIHETIKIVLLKLGLLEFTDFFVGNEDVTLTKPYPEIYWKCMTRFEVLPLNTVIFEDSHIGRKAALSSGAHLIPVENRNDLTIDKIEEALTFLSQSKNIPTPWRSKKLNVLIPMAGAGSRFQEAGFTFPKPLIDVLGKPMIQVVVENLNIEANFIFIVQKDAFNKYNLKYLLNLIAPGCQIIQVEQITQGAACTTLLAKEYIDNNNPLIIANSDQFIEWNSNECIYAFESDGIDGGILTFESSHPMWSFAKINDDGFVSEVAEKKPISTNATVGVYYWKKGSDYVKYAEQMIEKDIRTNNEFYVCPVYNEAIQDGKRIRIKKIKKMWGLGTPETLDYFMKSHNFREL